MWYGVNSIVSLFTATCEKSTSLKSSSIKRKRLPLSKTSAKIVERYSRRCPTKKSRTKYDFVEEEQNEFTGFDFAVSNGNYTSGENRDVL